MNTIWIRDIIFWFWGYFGSDDEDGEASYCKHLPAIEPRDFGGLPIQYMDGAADYRNSEGLLNLLWGGLHRMELQNM